MKKNKKTRADFKSDLEFNGYVDLVKQTQNKKLTVEYEPFNIPYSVTTYHNYYPDFGITFADGHVRLIEFKGYFRPQDRGKMLRVKKCNPKLDIRFVFPIDNKLGKKYKMRYSDWCKKYGFKYHIGTEVPKKWLTRRG